MPINPNTGNNTAAIVRGDYMDGILSSQFQSAVPVVVYDYPEILVPLLVALVEIWGFPEGSIPNKKNETKFNNWINQLETLNKLFSSEARMKLAMKYSLQKYKERGDKSIIHQPMSLHKILTDGIRELRIIEKANKEKTEVTQKASKESIKGAIKDLKKSFDREDD